MHWSELDSLTTKLSRGTRHLQTVFKNWSLGKASEEQVSQAFVELGNEYQSGSRWLARSNLTIPNIVDVPEELRRILETALSMEQSPEAVDTYDLQIRNVMTRLFRQLKALQVQMQHMAQQDAAPKVGGKPPQIPPPSPRNHPTEAYTTSRSQVPRSTNSSEHGSGTSTPPPLTQAASSVPAAQPRALQSDRNGGHIQTVAHSGPHAMPYPRQRPRTNSNVVPAGKPMNAPKNSGSLGEQTGRSSSASKIAHPSGATGGARPSNEPTGAAPSINVHQAESISTPMNSPGLESMQQHGENNALYQLQKSGALERQASKRYSTRQISRMINGSPGRSSALPTTSVHKTFNRPEVRESSVVKESGNIPDTPEKSQHRHYSIPPRGGNASLQIQMSIPPSISNDGLLSVVASQPGPDGTSGSEDSENGKKERSFSPGPEFLSSGSGPSVSSTPLEPPNNELTVFLRSGQTVRKGKVPKPPSLAALRLQFVEVCAYVFSGEESFPEIMLQDPKTGVDYEVTEAAIGDVTDGSLLTLNVKNQQQISTESELKEIKQALKDLTTQVSALSKSDTKPRSFANESNGTRGGAQISGQGLGYAPSPGAYANTKFTSPVLTGDGKFRLEKGNAGGGNLASASSPTSSEKERALVTELGHIKTATATMVRNFRTEISTLKEEIKNLSAASVTVVSDPSSLSTTRERMENESHDLLGELEAVSDIIDRQRLDVLDGGHRYTQHELDQVRKLLDKFSSSFEISEQYFKTKHPVWRKVWQAGLTDVIEGQEWAKNLETLYSDLRNDLNNTRKVFSLVCEANAIPKPVTSTRQTVPFAPPIEPGKEQEAASAMFEDITALNLNSEQRTEAMMRAERHHRAKQALRTEEFVAELNSFVTDSKLKNNGGYEEVERRMKEREEQTRKLAEESEVLGRQQAEKLKAERKAQREAQRAQVSTGEANSSAD